MILEIKNVKDTRNKADGNFYILGHNRALITISIKRNPTLAAWGSTLLHEMLHLWTTLMRYNGLRVTDKREHKFIYAVEDAVLKTIVKYLKRRKQK